MLRNTHLNIPQLKIEMESVFRNAIKSYERKKIKFADALMEYWGLEKDLSVIFTYDEKEYRKIEGLEVRKPWHALRPKIGLQEEGTLCRNC